MDLKKLSSRGKEFCKMIEFDGNEQLVWEIRKDPFGLFLVYLTGTFVTLIVFLALVIGPLAVNENILGISVDLGTVKPIVTIFGFFLTVGTIIGTVIGAYLYQANVVLVTSEKLAQLRYKNLFDRDISQMSIGDVQDVSIHQKGVLARIFKYGTLVIETAGEQNNYVFTYTPDPYETGKAIVGAHEENLKKYGN